MKHWVCGLILGLFLAVWPTFAEETAPAAPPQEPAPSDTAAPTIPPDQMPPEPAAKDELPGSAGTEPSPATSALPPDFYKKYEDVSLQAWIDNSRPSIGDWVTCRLTAEGPEGVEFKRAELPDKLPDYLALKYCSAQAAKTEKGRVTKTWEFTLDFFFTGQFPLVPVVVTYKGKEGQERQLLSPVFFVDVQDLPLDPQNPADIRPNKPMAEIRVSYRELYLIAGVVLTVVLLLGVGIPLLVRWLRKAEELPPLPAHAIAYEQMRKLIEDRLPEQGRIEEYYVRLSDICRHYLENRFGLRAPERTTEEFLVVMAETSALREPHKQLVRDFLRHCDLVKFARYGPTGEEMEAAFASAKRLVDETREANEANETNEAESET